MTIWFVTKAEYLSHGRMKHCHFYSRPSSLCNVWGDCILRVGQRHDHYFCSIPHVFVANVMDSFSRWTLQVSVTEVIWILCEHLCVSYFRLKDHHSFFGLFVFLMISLFLKFPGISWIMLSASILNWLRWCSWCVNELDRWHAIIHPGVDERLLSDVPSRHPLHQGYICIYVRR